MTDVVHQITDMIVQVVLIPALLAIGSALLVIIRSYVKKVSESLVAKYEMDSLSALTTVSNNLNTEIDKAVDSAVAKMMVTVEELKSKNNGQLTKEDIAEVNNKAKDLIFQTLPISLTEEGGTLNKIAGGTSSLNTLIDGLIEKHVVEQKAKIRSFR